MNWQLLAGVIATGLSTAGAVEAVKAFARRGPTKAEAAATINEMMLNSAAAIAADAEKTHAKLREMADEADRLRAEVRVDRERLQDMGRDIQNLSQQVNTLTTRMRHWRRAILSPSATLDALREMVSTEPGENGRSRDL